MTERDTAALSDGAIDRLERAARDAGLFAGHRRTLRSLIAGHAQQDERIASLEAAFIAVRDAIPASIEERCDGIPLAVADLAAQYAHVGRLHSNVSRMLMAVEAERDEARAQLAAVTAERDAALLGCEIAYRRVPTQDEGDAHEAGEPAHAKGECFVAMGGWTGRRCRYCNRWTWGGPTACAGCAQLAEARREVERVTAALGEAARSLVTVSECHKNGWPNGDWYELRAWARNRASVANAAFYALPTAAPSAPAESASDNNERTDSDDDDDDLGGEVCAPRAPDAEPDTAGARGERKGEVAERSGAQSSSEVEARTVCASSDGGGEDRDARGSRLESAPARGEPAESASEHVTVARDSAGDIEVSGPGMTKADVTKLLRDALAFTIAEPVGSASARNASMPDDLRDAGWCVAVHNDYRLNGERFTFWLFTKDGRAVRGEGRTDAEALNVIREEALSEPPESAPARGEHEMHVQGDLPTEGVTAASKIMRDAYPREVARGEAGAITGAIVSMVREPALSFAEPPAPREPAPDCSACKGRGCYNTDDGVEHTCGTCHGWGDTKPREPAPEPAAVLPASIGEKPPHQELLDALAASRRARVEAGLVLEPACPGASCEGDCPVHEAAPEPAAVLPADAVTHERARDAWAGLLVHCPLIPSELTKLHSDVLVMYIEQQAARDREQAAYRAKVEAFLRLFDEVHVYVHESQFDKREALYEARRALTDHGAERAGGES